MQKFLIIIAASVIWLGVAPIKTSSQSAEIPAVIITEIGAFEPSETEWIEIYNRSSASADITGWKFFEDGVNHGLTAFRGDLVLEPAEYVVVANKADLFAQKYQAYNGAIFDSSWSSLKEEGEEIGLKDRAGNSMEVFTYPSFINAVGTATVSLERIDINLAAADASNWEPHPESNSLGQPYHRESITAPLSIVENGSSTAQENGASTDTETQQTTTETQTNPTPVAEQAAVNALQTAEEPPSQAQNTLINSPPQAIIQVQSGQLLAQNSTTVNFDGRASSDPNGDSLLFFWDMGDGTLETSANPGPHSFREPGTYIVTLTVIDPSGAQGKASQYVQVLKKAPIKNTNVQKTPPAQQTAESSSNINLESPLPLFKLFNSAFEINAHIVFQPLTDNSKKKQAKTTKTVASPKKSANTAVKTTNKTKASAQKKSKTAPKKKAQPAKQPKKSKTAFRNGDLSDSIKITEIMPAPEEAGNEWIEIFNEDVKPVNLGNWALSDAAKKSSPYRIPDSTVLLPGAYAIFQKSETKIALNNDRDKVSLADFQEKTIDSVSYENAKKDYSYALIRLISQPEFLASSQPRALASDLAPRDSFAWEWTSETTPASPNPALEKIKGTVSRLLAGGENPDMTFNVTTPNGATKIVRFTAEALDPTIAEAVMQEGTIVSLQAKQQEDGAYELKKIEEVQPSVQREEEKNNFPWLGIGIIAAAALLNGPWLIAAFRKWKKGRSS